MGLREMEVMLYIKLIHLIIKNGIRPYREWVLFLEKLDGMLYTKLPIWYKLFMLIDFNDVYVIVDSSDGYEFKGTHLGFDFVFDEYEMNEDDKLKWLLENSYVPLADDCGGGDYFFLDVKNSRIVQVYHDEYGIGVINESIYDFVLNLRLYV